MVERIKSLCASRGISLNDLERSCDGLSVNTIYRWDNAPPSVWKVKAVADYFGVSVDYLLGRETSISESDMADICRFLARFCRSSASEMQVIDAFFMMPL